MSIGYYNMDGEAIDSDEAIALFSSDTARLVGRDTKDGITVSTILLVIDHAFGDSTPLIFETMIFGGDHDNYQERYATRTEAEIGHERACAIAFKEDS